MAKKNASQSFEGRIYIDCLGDEFTNNAVIQAHDQIGLGNLQLENKKNTKGEEKAVFPVTIGIALKLLQAKKRNREYVFQMYILPKDCDEMEFWPTEEKYISPQAQAVLKRAKRLQRIRQKAETKASRGNGIVVKIA